MSTTKLSRMIHRALSLLCAAALVAGLTLVPASAASFPDVRPGGWYYDTVSRMAELGAVNGFPDGTFGPEKSISLTELCKIGIDLFPGPALEEYFTAQELSESRAYMAEENPGYWGNDVILESLLLRDVHGLGFDEARWEQPLTRMELTYVVSNIYLTSDIFPTSGDPDTVDPSVAALIGDYDSAGIRGSDMEPCVLWAYALGIVGGVNANGDFNPQGTVSRAEACTILSRLLYPETRLTPGENTSSQTPGQSEAITDPLALLPAGTDVAGNSRIHYAGDVAYDYCRALEQEIGIPIFYLPEFTEKADGLLSYANFNDFPIDATYFQLVLTELQKMKSAYDLYPDGFLREVESKKGSHSTEIILCPYTFPGYTSYGVHVYDYSNDPVKVDQVFYTGVGNPQYYSHEMGHMVMSSAAIQGGWSTVCDHWESMNARAGASDYVSAYAMTSRPEDWAETWAFLWHDTDTVRTLVNGGSNVLREKVQYMTSLLAQSYSTFNASAAPWSALL